MPATPIDKLNDLICSLENDEHLSPDMNDLLQLLREQQEALPTDADEDTVDEAVRGCLRSHQAFLFSRLEEQLTEEEAPAEDGLEDGPGYDLEDDFEFDGDIPDWLAQEDPDELLPDDEELRELLRRHSEAGDLMAASLAEELEAHLQAEDLYYVRTPEEEKPVCYELPFKLKSCLVRFLLTVVKTSIIFEVRLPISVDPLYRMVLTSRINDINNELPFGSFHCTEEGIVVLRYMHVTGGSFCEDNFRFLMGGLISHIEENFEELRRMAAGRLHRFHRETLRGQLAELLNDLETF
ncbi:MAG: YbjN domain-containing protein [Butyricicoccaceae bacterium]